MELRGVISDKQILSEILEQSYLSAISEQDFYQRLINLQINLYYQREKPKGVKMKRKFRFSTLGYPKEALLNLNKSVSKNNRLDELNRIREKRKDRFRNK